MKKESIKMEYRLFKSKDVDGYTGKCRFEMKDTNMLSYYKVMQMIPFIEDEDHLNQVKDLIVKLKCWDK